MTLQTILTRVVFVFFLVLLSIGSLIAVQNTGSEVGVLYYQVATGFHAIPKVAAKVSGRKTISGKIPGATSGIRLPAGEIPHFRICGVDPTRFKLYILKPNKNERVLEMTKVGVFFGGVTSVIDKSEIEVAIQAADGNCFSLAPREALDRGEYAFSPVDANDVYDFGIGTVNPKRK